MDFAHWRQLKSCFFFGKCKPKFFSDPGLHFFNQCLRWREIYFCNAFCLSFSGYGWSDRRHDTKNLLKIPILFESSWFQTRFFKTTSPCLLWLLQSTFFYCKVFFNTLLPRKNLDIVKLCDPKSRKVEEVFLFLKINGAFHKKRSQHFSQKPITRVICHFFLQTWMLFVVFASSNRNSTVQMVSKIAHDYELIRWSSTILRKQTAASVWSKS